jgi:hypothetical protein
MERSYWVAAIDVHKSMLAVVVSDVAREGEFAFERRKYATTASELSQLRDRLVEQGVREVVMESTAQYWKPVWQQLEGHCELFLAQAHSNRAPRGRKRDFADAERLLRRHVAGELILSFVPNAEQRLWRTMTRSKHQLTRDRVRLHNQVESFLERTPASSYRVGSAICWASAAVAFSRRSPVGRRMWRSWPPWPIRRCVRPANSCKTHSAPPPRWEPCTGRFLGCFWRGWN